MSRVLKRMGFEMPAIVVAAVFGLLVAACGGGMNGSGSAGAGTGASPVVTANDQPAAGKNGTLRISGAGASFPAPLYEKWIHEYGKANPGTLIDYQSIGSGGGIQQITNRTVDFGASDAPMTEEELAAVEGTIVHIPMTMGSVALTYNLPEVDVQLKMTGELVVDIFDGKVKNWSDPAIAALNPGVQLPDQPIAVVHRSDSSGTTFIFTEYLAAISDHWEANKSPEWPTGIGAKGNEGVAGQIKQTYGSFGYVELAYAVENQLPVVALQNKDGNFIEPTLEGTSRAASGALSNMPEDYRVSIVNQPGEGTYPIAAFTYLLVYEEMDDAEKAEALLKFIQWAIRDGQEIAPELLYVPLPDDLVAQIEETLKTIKVDGKPILR